MKPEQLRPDALLPEDGAWLITAEDSFRFEKQDDPYHETMRYVLKMGAVILIWAGNVAELRFNVADVNHECLMAGLAHRLYPLAFAPMDGSSKVRRQAMTRQQAEAMAADFLRYRSLELTPRTVIVDLPPAQILASSPLLQAHLADWRNSEAANEDELIKLVHRDGQFFTEAIGRRSAAARFHGLEWCAKSIGTPTLKSDANEFERAVDSDYYRALEQRIPILQDVHAFIPDEENRGQRESYRRLITPITGSDGEAGVLVASCVLRDIPVPGKPTE
ncbi:hypothetical protein EOI86_23090 [Hwanghaeella grinnelliae]|uniref:Uncharacterized protein n=1 Tax=Hwanghaeella grinnelliae TaxID=2500179 RepID=A0A3S2Z689_9PROT|nr:hypothetical protein [Hwanghaeella grinnelliae]RVU34010.1 hypothetical protein EOI86_23090 [Hwanghaeella grinnelliae]